MIAAMPWDGHADLLAELAGPLAGKIVIDCVNPMGFDSRGAYSDRRAEGSAAEQAAAVLPGQHRGRRVPPRLGHLLLDPDVDSMDLDVLVLGDDRAATDLVIALAGGDPRHARRIRRQAAQLRPGRGADGEPGRPSTAGTRRTPGSASPTSDQQAGRASSAAQGWSVCKVTDCD